MSLLLMDGGGNKGVSWFSQTDNRLTAMPLFREVIPIGNLLERLCYPATACPAGSRVSQDGNCTGRFQPNPGAWLEQHARHTSRSHEEKLAVYRLQLPRGTFVSHLCRSENCPSDSSIKSLDVTKIYH